MSIWTHVVACARIEYYGLDSDSIFGMERPTVSGSSREVSEDFYKHPERYLPSGSEGTLRKIVCHNPDPFDTGKYIISIFGDLRDHYDPDGIIDWFRKKLEHEDLYVKQAVITVENDRYGVRTWAYIDDFDREISKRRERFEVKYVD